MNTDLINIYKRSVMGILNVTPDSFFDGGKYVNVNAAVDHVVRMASDGAAIIDIGAVSTRPGAIAPSTEDEWKRLKEVVVLVRKELQGVLLSIDTYRSEIARRAVDSGADIINDISGGTMDDNMFPMMGALQVPYVLMHIQGTPATMQIDPQYSDVVEDVKQFFRERIDLLRSFGAKEIILDPGFGFGKTLDHNMTLLENLSMFTEFRLPILAGISRKSMVMKKFGVTKENALEGTIELNRIALKNGANILRVHDVKEAVALLEIGG